MRHAAPAQIPTRPSGRARSLRRRTAMRHVAPAQTPNAPVRARRVGACRTGRARGAAGVERRRGRGNVFACYDPAVPPATPMDSAPQRAGGDTAPGHGGMPSGSRAAAGGSGLRHRPARPFLKWAGGKRQLLPELRRFYPPRFETYHEPFVGSGAVFFDLVGRRSVRRRRVRLTDVNPDLIGCWRQLRDNREAVIDHLRELANERVEAPEEHYYSVRERFNGARGEMLDHGRPQAASYTATLAAMLIYLNRTGFNGLFRVNARGLFNVPRGRYRNPRICDEHNLRRASEALSTLEAKVDYAKYDAVLDVAEPGDFIYLDPPYAPLSSTASFTSYTADRFDAGDQQRLQQVVIELAERHCHVVLSNSTAPEIRDLYDGNADAEGAGVRAHRVAARRAINSNAARRGPVEEYVITNVAPGRA